MSSKSNKEYSNDKSKNLSSGNFNQGMILKNEQNDQNLIMNINESDNDLKSAIKVMNTSALVMQNSTKIIQDSILDMKNTIKESVNSIQDSILDMKNSIDESVKTMKESNQIMKESNQMMKESNQMMKESFIEQTSLIESIKQLIKIIQEK